MSVSPNQRAKFRFTREGECLHIRLHESRFDAACVAEFKEDLISHWRENIQKVEIDFSEVSFLDSSGVGALLSIQKRLSNSDEPIALLRPQPTVVSVIELLRLQRLFRIVED